MELTLAPAPILPWSVFVLSETIIFTWIFQNTRGSVLMATLYHGSSNLGMILYGGIDPAWAPWFKCSTSKLIASCVLTWGRSELEAGAPRASAGEPSNNRMKLTKPALATHRSASKRWSCDSHRCADDRRDARLFR